MGVLFITYESNDRYGLFAKLASKPSNLLSGHFPLNKYLPIYNLKNVICFVREPAQQIRSHFEHFVRIHGYKKSFMEFIQEQRFINFQSKQLRGVSLQSVGFIGLTERYQESLEMINNEYNFSIPVRHINKNTNKSVEFYEFSDEEKKLIKDLNSEDYEMYDIAKNLFERRLHCFHKGFKLYRGELTPHALPKVQRDKFIHGWLTSYANDEISKGFLLINNKTRIDIEAKDFRPWVKERLNQRMGYVGFHQKLPKELKEGDKLTLNDQNGLVVYSGEFRAD